LSKRRHFLWIGLLLSALVLSVVAIWLPTPRIAFHSLFGLSGKAATEQSTRDLLQPAAGYAVNLFAAEIPNARWLLLTPGGDLLVSSPNLGSIYRLRDNDGDGISDKNEVLIEGLNLPHGLAFKDGWLYIAETDAIGRLPWPADKPPSPAAYERIVTGIPGGGNHWRRVIAFGPDHRLYLAVGSSCNVCQEQNPLRGTLIRYNPDGSGEEVMASGLRNATGFDWAPWDGSLYATENARDWLGDDFPPDELNRIIPGGFYGWPYFNGDNIPDPDLGDKAARLLDRALPPVHEFRPHNAPLGITFLRHQPGHLAMEHIALVALHGSWNRSKPDGYEVVALHWDTEGKIRQTDFVTGFMQNGEVSGRPVHVVEDREGTLYISDDFADAVYRVTPVE